MFDNIQFDEPEQSWLYYDTIDEWVKDGIVQFLQLMQLSEPKSLMLSDTRLAQTGALKSCADMLADKERVIVPSYDTLESWYKFSLMDFISSTYKEVPSKFIPSVVKKGKENDYIENVVVEVINELSNA